MHIRVWDTTDPLKDKYVKVGRGIWGYKDMEDIPEDIIWGYKGYGVH